MDGAAQAHRVWSRIQWATSATCIWWILARNISDPSELWEMCCAGVCILVMTVVFVLPKSSGVCLQGACEMTVTISAESPPSSYQFFVLK